MGCRLWVVALVFWAAAFGLRGSSVELYATSFEIAEGYDPAVDLDGQQGWVSLSVSNDGNSGLIAVSPGSDELSAYIGFLPEALGERGTLVWQPLQPAPVPSQFPLITFSVLAGIADSVDFPNRDDFCWEVYNQQERRLFSVFFSNRDLMVYYVLENGSNALSTGFEFVNDQFYALELQMDFEGNQWQARIDGQLVVTNAPLTEFGSDLNLGDVRAGWLYSDPSDPGDNFMAFDDYRLTGVPATARARLLLVRRLADGRAVVRVVGRAGCTYALEGSGDLKSWTVLTVLEGGGDYTDPQGAVFSSRFYRARVIP